MREKLKAALSGADLQSMCLCGPSGLRTASSKEILAVIGVIHAAGHDPEVIVSRVRKMDKGRLSGFVLDPDLKHYGACVPVELLCLAAEGL